MNWDAIGAVAEMLGGVAVVVSLIYVARQIKQNTEEAITARTQHLISTNSDANSQIANNGELARIMQTGFFSYDEMDPVDQVRFGTFCFSIFNQYDFAYHQYLTGKLDPTVWKKMDYEMPLFLGLSGSNSWWQKDKQRFSAEFASYIDKRIAELERPDVMPTLSSKELGNGT